MNTRTTSGPTDDERRVFEAIRTCPDRGRVLPVSLQPECGCAELTECRAGKGRSPGAVTTIECLQCRGAALGIG